MTYISICKDTGLSPLISRKAFSPPISSTDASWVTVSSVTSTTGASVSYTIAVNTGAARSATINIAGLSYTITQQKAVTNVRKK